MADKREVRVAVVGDASQLQRELLRAECRINSFGDQARTAGDTLRSALLGTAVLYGAKRLVDASAQLEQAVGGTAAVFREASKPVEDFAKNAAELAGLSEEAARTLTSRLGASLKGFGLSAEEAAEQSVFLAQTGADLAATLGGSTQEAVNALGAALRGEFDPLERFGIALKASDVAAKAVSMGLARSETDVSNYAKGQAALALITEKSGFAQGQFAREATTAAGAAAIAQAKTQNASADLGRSLLPIYTKINEVVSAVASAFSALPGPAQTAVIALTGVAIVGPKIYSGLQAATSAMKALPAVLEKAALSAVDTQKALNGLQLTTGVAGQSGAAAAGGLALLGPAAIAVAGAAAIGAVAWKSYSDEQAAVARDIKELIPTFDDLSGALTQTTFDTVQATLRSRNQIDNLNNAGITVRQFTEAIDDNRDALVKQGEVERILRIQRELGTNAVRKDIDAIRDRGGSQNELIARLLETKQADEGLIDTLYNSIDAYNEQQEIIRQNNIQKALSTGKTLEQAEAEANLKAELDKVNESLKDQLKAINDLLGAQISEEEARINGNKALADYNNSLKDGTLTADQRKSSELDLLKSFQQQAEASVKAAKAQAELEGKTLSAGQSAAIQSQKLQELAATLGPNDPLRKRIEELGVELFLLSLNDPEIKIRMETEEALRQFRQFLRDIGIGPNENVPLEAIFSYGNRWSGGPVNANSPYIVGEKGPELFVPSSFGRIIDAFSTSKMMVADTAAMMSRSSGDVYVTVNQTDPSPYEIGREILWQKAVSR